MLVYALTGEVGVPGQTSVENGLVLGIDVPVFARKGDGKMPVAFRLRIKHSAKCEQPGAVTATCERGMERRMSGGPGFVHARQITGDREGNSMQAMIRRHDGGLPFHIAVRNRRGQTQLLDRDAGPGQVLDSWINP